MKLLNLRKEIPTDKFNAWKISKIPLQNKSASQILRLGFGFKLYQMEFRQENYLL